MRILLADDQIEVRLGIKVLLELEPELEVVGEAIDLISLRAMVLENSPDVVLLDWELPGFHSAGLVNLQEIRPGLKVIALSGRPESRKNALTAGADGFVSKGDQPERLLRILHELGGKDNQEKASSYKKKSNRVGGVKQK